ncbi:Imm53 family immunity protein [Actinokineospora xionganensis]|uniref:Uncharacterized protein n=1 Tax=Actinokineospora xionganensis TaxID=2684470 RepID=A0ABR7L721_9PSEU|nr:Imm53 family immunity protein [Actinokineospora xionganensis]MBC6448487.1 hypothetical protein [Actinokineospora xionganensis]
MPESALGFPQRWYQSQCDEEWEHELGVKIDTLDNPLTLEDVLAGSREFIVRE